MVSVILPVYNGEKYIKEAIDSVLTQTFDKFELIIINDGSTDSTKDIVLGYKDTRIKYFYQTNKGEAASRNEGIRNSKFDLVTFIDADDIYEPNKLMKQYKILNENLDIDVVCIAGTVVDETLNKISEARADISFENKENLLVALFG